MVRNVFRRGFNPAHIYRFSLPWPSYYTIYKITENPGISKWRYSDSTSSQPILSIRSFLSKLQARLKFGRSLGHSPRMSANLPTWPAAGVSAALPSSFASRKWRRQIHSSYRPESMQLTELKAGRSGRTVCSMKPGNQLLKKHGQEPSPESRDWETGNGVRPTAGRIREAWLPKEAFGVSV